MSLLLSGLFSAIIAFYNKLSSKVVVSHKEAQISQREAWASEIDIDFSKREVWASQKDGGAYQNLAESLGAILLPVGGVLRLFSKKKVGPLSERPGSFREREWCFSNRGRGLLWWLLKSHFAAAAATLAGRKGGMG